MDNPFSDVGCILSGTRVVGRDHEIRKLRDKLCAKSGYGSVAVIGMPRIGKSSLIQRALLDDERSLANDKILCSRIDVGTLGCFDELLGAMALGTLSKAHAFNLCAEQLQSLADRLTAVGGEARWEMTIEFFRVTRLLCIRPICVLDEFDATRRLFHGDVQSFLRLRSLASTPEFKVGLVLVCKRDLTQLSEQAGLQSNYWHNAVGSELYVRGFGDADLHLYFATLERTGISLTREARDELVRICGTHPFLLDLFAAEAFPLASTGKVIDLNICRELATPLLPKAFTQLVEVLRGGFDLSALKAALNNGPPRPLSTEIQALLRLGVLVQDGRGKLKPFAGTLPDYLRLQETALPTPSDPDVENPGFQEHSCSRPIGRQKGPFRFHAGKNALVAANGISTPLEPRFWMVLRAMFSVDSPGSRTFTSSVKYDSVATQYVAGLKIEQPGNQAALAKRITGKGSDVMKLMAQQFRRDLRRWLNDNGIDITEIVTCNLKEGGYQLVASGWADSPVIYASEATQLTTAPETITTLAGPQFSRTPIRDSGA